MAENPGGPQVGATAAAVLLGRHGESPRAFGLSEAPGLPPELNGYRYGGPEQSAQIRRWYESERAGD